MSLSWSGSCFWIRAQTQLKPYQKHWWTHHKVPYLHKLFYKVYWNMGVQNESKPLLWMGIKKFWILCRYRSIINHKKSVGNYNFLLLLAWYCFEKSLSGCLIWNYFNWFNSINFWVFYTKIQNKGKKNFYVIEHIELRFLYCRTQIRK